MKGALPADLIEDEPLAASTLLKQFQDLQSSVLEFQAKANAQYTPIDVSSYAKSLASDMRSLQKISTNLGQTRNPATNEDSDDALGHALRSSNLSFLQMVWDTARRCRNVVALHRKEGGKNGSKMTLVDIIADMGLLWVKIVTVGERKLLFELAKEGDIWNDSGDEDNDELNGTDYANGTNNGANHVDDDAEDGLPLIRMVKGLVSAARDTKVQYRHPEVLIYFPKLDEDKITTPAVSKVLAALRATGATIHCGPGEIKLKEKAALQPCPTTVETFETMLPQTHPELTPVLNIDCTILLALISDLSHLCLDEKDTYNEPLKKQLATERERPLLSQVLYPVLAGRKLITSTHAAQRMRDIVGTLGMPGEKARADILLGEGSIPTQSLGEKDLLDQLRAESIYEAPPDLHLPIKIIDVDVELQSTPAPDSAALLDPLLSDINRSVFLLGWIRNAVTATSNRAVAKQIEAKLSEAPGDVIGPDLWVIDIARSLVGKERTRRG